MDIREFVKHIINLSDVELKLVAKQSLKLANTGICTDQPLRGLIDNYPMGDMYGASAVPQLIMQECTKRWIESEE